MMSTIADVKSVAREIWPSAVRVNVALVAYATRKTYRVSAFGENDRFLGQDDAYTLDDLKSRLELRAAAEAEKCQPNVLPNPSLALTAAPSRQ